MMGRKIIRAEVVDDQREIELSRQQPGSYSFDLTASVTAQVPHKLQSNKNLASTLGVR